MKIGRVVLIGMLCFGLAFGLFAVPQKEKTARKKATARDIFFAGSGAVTADQISGGGPMAMVTMPPTAPLGVNYKIIKQTPGCDLVTADPNGVFRTGDKIKFVVTANTDGFLYLFHQGASGRGTMLFPDRRINSGQNQVAQGVEYMIPSSGWFEFDPHPGMEKVYLFLCKQKISSIENAVSQPQQPGQVPFNVLTEFQRGAQQGAKKKKDIHLVESVMAPLV